MRKELPKGIAHTAETKRWATNEAVASWRAHRLRCNTLIEIGCGIGMQTRAFAHTCDKVIAIERDPEKLALAKQNCKAKNVSFVQGDGLKLLAQLQGNVVFCDPSRPETSKERSIEELSPNIRELLTVCQQNDIPLAVELPPQIRNIPFLCEREYVAYHSMLNRLTAYTGTLQKAAASAVDLPQGNVISGKPGPPIAGVIDGFLCELSPAVVRAGLSYLIGPTVTDGKATFVTQRTSSKHVVTSYRVVAHCRDKREVREILSKKGFGKALLRVRVPSDQYWTLRKELESGLEGEQQAVIFQISGQWYVCQKNKDTNESRT